MKRTVEMPEVMECDAVKCAYNMDYKCHARGITVGNSSQHICDTMYVSRDHTTRPDSAGVGACRSTNCVHNDDFECQADGIDVTTKLMKAVCATFSKA